MANSHPYISGPGNIAQMIRHLRNSFPSTVTSATVRRLGIAPKNESFVINVLQYIGVLDDDGNKTEEAARVFSHHKDDEFASALEGLVRNAYSGLFDLHGDTTWSLDDDALITFFRQSDQTGATIGRRQAATFKVLAALSGHGEMPPTRAARKAKAAGKSEAREQPRKPSKPAAEVHQRGSPEVTARQDHGGGDIGLTVRVEINLPADGSRETYDNIFRSIKENLLGG